jgi:hypothetical protein
VEMVKLILACVLLPVAVSAAGFTLSIGPPVAAGTGKKVTKSAGASFAVRLEECDSLEAAQISSTAEGLVDGARRSVPVAIIAAGSPGVYVVSETEENPGVWVVNVNAICGKAKAAAIVAIGPQGFVRESTKVLPRAATKTEIDAALKEAAQKALERPAK